MAEGLSFSSRSENKRKLDDQSGATSPSPVTPASRRQPTGFSSPIISTASGAASLPSYNNVPPPLDGIELAKQRAQEIAARIFSAAEAKRPRVENVDGSNDSSNNDFGSDRSIKPMGQSAGLQFDGTNSSFSSYGHPGSSKKFEIPSGRVGVIIGRSGETIKYLQAQSGARIQITRDIDAEPNSLTRTVDIVGTPEQISKAEQMINDVISEADAGGSGVSSARKFTSVSIGSEHFSMKVPNNKVGLIIGKGGENIKNMQATCGARIQVIPLHLPPGDTSTERTVHIDGTKEQIELAKQLVNDATSEDLGEEAASGVSWELLPNMNRVRNPQSGGYHSSRPPTNWIPSGASAMQHPSYGYMQPGAYPGTVPYGGYPPPPSTGWDQLSNSLAQQSTQATGYDYYNQQQQQQQQQPQQQQPVGGSSVSFDGNNYNYNQMNTSYSGESTYSQPTVQYQQYYGHAGGYNQAGSQAGYSQQGYSSALPYDNSAVSTQEGANSSYGVQGSTQQAPLGQQPTNQPVYGSQPSIQADLSQSSQSQVYPYFQPPIVSSGYGQDAQQLTPGHGSQAGYGQQQPYGGAPHSHGTGYVQQQPQSYNDAYSAGPYSQPLYSTEGIYGTSTEPSGTTGAEKISPQT